MTTPNSGPDPYRSGHYPAPNGEQLRARWNAATCLTAFVLTLPLVYGLYPTLAAATQTFGGLSTTALVVLWATAWLVLWITLQSALEWRRATVAATS